jgi:hypothetical protein
MAILGSSLKLGIISFEGRADSINTRVIKQSPSISDTLSKVSMGTQIDIVLGGN